MKTKRPDLIKVMQNVCTGEDYARVSIGMVIPIRKTKLTAREVELLRAHDLMVKALTYTAEAVLEALGADISEIKKVFPQFPERGS